MNNIDRYIKQTIRVHGMALIAGRCPDGYDIRLRKIAVAKGWSLSRAHLELYGMACEAW